MIILRTDGGGVNFADERLKLLREMVNFHKFKVFKLHDHKGLLTVTWEEEPEDYEKKMIEHAWEFLSEEHVSHEVIYYKSI